MSRSNKYRKSLEQQLYMIMQGMIAYGEKKTDQSDGKIHSICTYQTYWKQAKIFLKYIKQNHPDCRSLKRAKRYAREWLESREKEGLSAYTLHTDAAVMAKLYGIKPTDKNRYIPPTRRREDITRSRVSVARDKHFSKTNNDELIRFARGTGCRRAVLENLTGADLWTREKIENRIRELQEKENLSKAEQSAFRALRESLEYFPEEYKYFVHHRQDKGGRERYAPIIGKDLPQIVARFERTAADELVWQHVHKSADIHSYRADYATALYKAHARPLAQIPYDKLNRGTGKKYQSEIYTCRKDEAGRKLDKKAMLIASKALGHNRLDVIAAHYLRGL